MTHKLLSNVILLAICITLLLLSFYSIASAQEASDSRPAHIGVFYPISTNGTGAPQYANDCSFHILTGVSRQENAFCLSGISSIVKGNVSGAVISGISSHIGGSARGLQLAGIVNLVKQRSAGVQLAGITNITGPVAGMQLAGLANVAHDQGGLQLSGLVNKSGRANVQIAGLVNIAKKVKGIQISGLINVAEDCDYPIGLINIIKNGEKQLGITTDESGNTLIAFRSGGKILYGIIGMGYNLQNPDLRYVLEGGLGAHLKLARRFRLNLELALTTLSDLQNDAMLNSSFRPLLAYKAGNQIEFFAGPTLNIPEYPYEVFRGADRVWDLQPIYIGWMGGIQISL